MSGRLHEDFGRDQPPEPGSERAFGFVMAVAIPVLVWLFLRPYWPVGTGLGAVFALLAVARPGLLAPLNRLWFRLGLLLGRIVAPIVMGVIFFAVVTPIALLRRALGKRSLDTRFDPEAPSYWVDRDPPGPEPGQLPRQF